jgi:chemotaxis protein MotB
MKRIALLVLVAYCVFTAGCAVNIYKKSPTDKARIERLNKELQRMKQLREMERDQFEAIKNELEKEFARKLKGQVGLDVQERGLVITLADNILFDSGKAKIKEDAHPVLDKIVQVIKAKAPDKNIGVEGHTDNVPITHSSWKSNRELSTARANNVYHYLADTGGLNPAKLMTIGYGEFHPVASNDTEEGRAKNRRVEIVIMPQYPKKAVEELEAEMLVK